MESKNTVSRGGFFVLRCRLLGQRRSTKNEERPLFLLDQRDEDALRLRERSREAATGRLREACREHLPGQAVWVYGSILTPGKFRPESDIDIALERLPDRRSLYALQSVLTEATGHEVDVCLLSETRLQAKIESQGQRWIESD